MDKLLYVDLPDADERSEIMRTLTRGIPLGLGLGVGVGVGTASDESKLTTAKALDDLVRAQCSGFSGADLAALVREAGVAALKRVLGAFEHADDDNSIIAPDLLEVTPPDFAKARQKMSPSVSPAQRRRYEALRTKLHSFTLKVGLDNDNDNSSSGGNKTVS